MNIFFIGSLIRAVVYLWVGVTALSIADLYKDGYNFAGKDSDIIKALISILKQLFFVFTMLAFVAIERAFESSSESILTLFLPIVVLPLGLFLTKFRKESVKKQ
jgi:hypothetical protein